MIEGLVKRLANTLRWSFCFFCFVFALRSLNRQLQTWNRHILDILAEKSLEKTVCLNHSQHLSHHNPPRTPHRTPHHTPTPHPTPHPAPTYSPHVFDRCSANWKNVFAFTGEQSSKDDASSLLELCLLLNEANVKITSNNYLCPFSCGLSLEVNSSNHTGASFSTFHR